MSETKSISINPVATYQLPVGQVIMPAVPIYTFCDDTTCNITFSVTVDRGSAPGNLRFLFFGDKSKEPIYIIPLLLTNTVGTQSATITTKKLNCSKELIAIVDSDSTSTTLTFASITLNSLAVIFKEPCCESKKKKIH